MSSVQKECFLLYCTHWPLKLLKQLQIIDPSDNHYNFIAKNPSGPFILFNEHTTYNLFLDNRLSGA